MTFEYSSTLELTSRAVGESDTWWQSVFDALVNLRERLLVDAQGPPLGLGVFQEAVDREPVLLTEALRLAAQRDDLIDRTGRLYRIVEEGPWDHAAADSVSGQLSELAVAESRYRENSWTLFWDSVDPPWRDFAAGHCCR